jgi:hypothetical protein
VTGSQFVVGLLRLAAIVLPTALVAHRIRIRYLGVSGCLAVVSEAVLGLSLLLLCAELLGLFSLNRPAALIPLLVIMAGLSCISGGITPSQTVTAPDSERPTRSGFPRDLTLLSAAIGLAVVVAQWCLVTADSLGAGMSSFDTLWYHMPFAARFAQSNSVTSVHFTQADPFVAYYPANSELFHAIGIEALHSDILSVFLNLFWLDLALLACWCFGRPWHLERLTLLAGCLLFSLPILGTTQPGQAFNDSAGLASLLAGVALIANKPDDLRVLAVAGLALGVAAGTKFTFVVPAAVLVVVMGASAPRGRGWRVSAALAIPGLLTAGWWYLRNVIKVGNPLGLQLHLGPLTTPGPVSPMAIALRKSVLSEMTHGALWGSRIMPGLAHAVGPVWLLVLALYLAVIIVGITLVSNRVVRSVAVASALAGIAYLLLPVGASGAELGNELFEVQLRFFMPALALALLLVPVLARMCAPKAYVLLGPMLIALLLATQLEHALWPTQPLRHVAFLGAAGGAVVLVQSGWRLHRRGLVLLPAIAIPVVLLLMGGVTFAAQRHYFNRRYLRGDSKHRGLGQIYRWAQGVADARIALYGTVLQYPLYGARDTNYVGYLGEAVQGSGYRPILSCQTWRTTIAAGRYQWVVIVLPGPTVSAPIAWTEGDPAMRLVLHPEAGAYVFKVTGAPHPQLCGQGLRLFDR